MKPILEQASSPTMQASPDPPVRLEEEPALNDPTLRASGRRSQNSDLKDSSRYSTVLGWIYSQPRLFPLSTDCLAWAFGLLAGAVLKLAFGWTIAVAEIAVLTAVAVLSQAALGTRAGIYRYRWRISSFQEVSALGFTWVATSTLLVLGNFIFRYSVSDLPSSAVIGGATIALATMTSTRAIWRRYWESQRRPDAQECRRTIVLGAGEGGEQVVKAMLSDPESAYYPAALLDDDPTLRQREISGVVVEGTRADLATVARRHGAEVLLIAIPSATSKLIQEVSQLAKEANLLVRVLPATSEFVTKMTVADVRPPTVDDLLGRDPVEIDLESVAGYVRGRRVLITGAGGSIGSELSRQVSRFGPSELYLLDRDESALHGLQLTMEGRALLESDRLVVADIRDRERVFELFGKYQPEVVFHTAALKHLTLLENHPLEGVKTNVLGTRNLLDAALKTEVDRFVNISTDKAADPTSVLGATKLAAEHLTANAAQKSGKPFLSVRFGNVLGSRGSVLPTFLDQIESGNPLTVTHPEATRFFMTIPEAVRLVVQAGAIGDPAEVLILDMGQPVKILDLANQLINLLDPSAKVEFTGLRPGEKLHEILVAQNEIGQARVHPRIIHTIGAVVDPEVALQTLDPETVAEAERLLADNPFLLH